MAPVGDHRRRISSAALVLVLFLASPAHGQPPPTGEVRLGPLIEEALQRNPEVLAARARLAAAGARIPQARALPDPTVGIETETTTTFGRSVETEYQVSQTFPFPGKLRLQGLVATREAEQIREELRAKEREIASRVKAAFYELFRAHRLIEVKRTEVEILKTFARIAEARYEVGKAAQQDVLKAQVELSKALTDLVTLEQERETAQAALNTLLNRAPRDPVGTPVPRDFRPFPARLEELEQFALDQRPEFRAAQRGIAKAEAAVDLANRQYYPDFSVGLQWIQAPGGRDKYEFIASINIPWLFTKSKYDARVQEATAQVANARATRDAVRNLTLLGVKDLFERVKASERIVTLYRTSIMPQASQALEAAIAGYQTGQVDFLTLLDSQRVLREGERTFFAAWADFEQRQADLERVVDMELAPPD